MALDVAELRRGRICYAVYPFASSFPAELADGTQIPNVEDFARGLGGGIADLKAGVRLRPVVLLHDGTRGDYGDIACLRVNSVKDKHRGSMSWPRITSHEHPLFFHLPPQPRYGLADESVIAINSVGTIHKSAILGPRHAGALSVQEMQIVSERISRCLSLDLAPLIADRARELLARAGFET